MLIQSKIDHHQKARGFVGPEQEKRMVILMRAEERDCSLKHSQGDQRAFPGLPNSETLMPKTRQNHWSMTRNKNAKAVIHYYYCYHHI